MKTSVFERFPELKKIPQEQFPDHVLIIPDGNGRWAKRINSIPIIGHRQGFNVLKEVGAVKKLVQVGIRDYCEEERKQKRSGY